MTLITSKDKRNNKHSPIKAANKPCCYIFFLNNNAFIQREKRLKKSNCNKHEHETKLSSNKYVAVLSTSIKLNSPL